LCIKTNCEHLGSAGCTLGDEKPFSCKLYPLSYNPAKKQLFFDSDCPLMPEYIRQLSIHKSVASLHLDTMMGEIKRLEKSDALFLTTNHAVDADYFSLERLPAIKSPKNES